MRHRYIWSFWVPCADMAARKEVYIHKKEIQ